MLCLWEAKRTNYNEICREDEIGFFTKCEKQEYATCPEDIKEHL